MPVQSLIIDGEVVACDDHGAPDFHALHLRKTVLDAMCVWAFDLLFTNGKDLREQPLVARKRILKKILACTGDHRLRFSEHFDDGPIILIAAEHLFLEGIVSKRVDTPYRSTNRADWIKVKCSELARAQSRTLAIVRVTRPTVCGVHHVGSTGAAHAS